MNGKFDTTVSSFLERRIIPKFSFFFRRVFQDCYVFSKGKRGDPARMAFFHRIENLTLRWKIVEHLCGITSMLDALLAIFEFLFGIVILIYVYNPKTQDTLTHRTKLQTYHRHHEDIITFELFHILSVDGQPGGFHPVLPRHITDLEFSGMARFEDAMDYPNQVMKHYREPSPIDWVEPYDFGQPGHPTPLVGPNSGIGAEPDDYNFKDLDQSSSWKTVEVLFDDIRKGEIYLREYHARLHALFRFIGSSNPLESPSFTESSDDDDLSGSIIPESFPIDYMPSPTERNHPDLLMQPLGPLLSLIAACSDQPFIPTNFIQGGGDPTPADLLEPA